MWYKTEDVDKKDLYLEAKEDIKKSTKVIWLDTMGEADFKKHSKVKHHERRMGRISKNSM